MNSQPPISQNVGASINNLKSGVTDSLNQFSEQASAGIGASTSFLQSNTMIAKFAFLILIVIAFMFLMNLGIMIIGYFTSSSSNPYLVKGMISGNTSMVVSQDPKQNNSAIIQRSNNQNSGLEFTWSTWLYINDLGNTAGKYQHIFNKGDNIFNSTTNLSTVNNAPGVYLGPTNNNLHIIMDTVSPNDTNTIIDISNIPLRKWFHTAIRMQNKILDVYINGVIAKRLLLNNVPKQNYNDVNICQNGGFSGNLSNLRYFSYALNVFDINNIVNSGPNLKVLKVAGSASAGSTMPNYTYLSDQWYSSRM